jgi:hypothetical protein
MEGYYIRHSMSVTGNRTACKSGPRPSLDLAPPALHRCLGPVTDALCFLSITIHFRLGAKQPEPVRHEGHPAVRQCVDRDFRHVRVACGTDHEERCCVRCAWQGHRVEDGCSGCGDGGWRRAVALIRDYRQACRPRCMFSVSFSG